MRTDGNGGDEVNYAPNSQNIYETIGEEEPPLRLEREALHYDFRDYDDDYFSQPKALYKLFDEGEKQRTAANIANHMSSIKNQVILERAINLWGNVSERLKDDIWEKFKQESRFLNNSKAS